MQCLALKDDFEPATYGSYVARTNYKFKYPVILSKKKKIPNWFVRIKGKTHCIYQNL